MPVVIVDRDAVQALLARIGVAGGQLLELGLRSATSELISPEMK